MLANAIDEIAEQIASMEEPPINDPGEYEGKVIHLVPTLGDGEVQMGLVDRRPTAVVVLRDVATDKHFYMPVHNGILHNKSYRETTECGDRIFYTNSKDAMRAALIEIMLKNLDVVKDALRTLNDLPDDGI